MRRDGLDALQRVRDIQERRARVDLAMAHRSHRDAVDAEASTWRDLDERTRALSAGAGTDRFLRTRAVTDAGVLAALHQAGALTKAAVAGLSDATLTAALTLGTRAAAVTVARAGANPPWANEL